MATRVLLRHLSNNKDDKFGRTILPETNKKLHTPSTSPENDNNAGVSDKMFQLNNYLMNQRGQVNKLNVQIKEFVSSRKTPSHQPLQSVFTVDKAKPK